MSAGVPTVGDDSSGNEKAGAMPADAGALPTLGQASTRKVLGAPKSKTKAKSNVTTLFYLVVVLLGCGLIAGGGLWFMKHRAAAAAPAKREAASKAAAGQRNAALENTGIEKMKTELKARQAQEEAAAKAREVPAVAPSMPAIQPAAWAESPPPRAGQPTPATQATQAPAALSPEERRITGAVLVNTAGVLPTVGAGGEPRASASTPSLSGAPSSASNTETLGGRLQPTMLEARTAGLLPNLDFLLKRGTTIPCALQTGIDTTLPGFVSCRTLSDVYSANGKTLLVERGASVFGEQQSGLKQGQERTFVVWTRIDNPSGVFANIDSPAVDQMGYGGVEGYVDTHFWKRFGGAILLSLIQDFSQSLLRSKSSSLNSGPTYNNSQQATQDMATEALRNSINIPPTLYVRPATVVNVMVARDVSFENVYALVR
ncbi:type IV secretion system protein VirB10 [Variovorax saccharolyticus]|uniref:type IV secretion system protein VirB10 n=1 Tax=Variovorax saccharolyticus TaxID=3053516 RepID=UPI0025772A9A|nr:type IV secretion system protein VirB10 [Variovorax sp. J31P216]MDM0029131.1 type IV secretion system protein VirB10 [Variovorax sp. J31P216]